MRIVGRIAIVAVVLVIILYVYGYVYGFPSIGSDAEPGLIDRLNAQKRLVIIKQLNFIKLDYDVVVSGDVSHGTPTRTRRDGELLNLPDGAYEPRNSSPFVIAQGVAYDLETYLYNEVHKK